MQPQHGFYKIRLMGNTEDITISYPRTRKIVAMIGHKANPKFSRLGSGLDVDFDRIHIHVKVTIAALARPNAHMRIHYMDREGIFTEFKKSTRQTAFP